MHVKISSRSRCIPLLPYFVYASSEGSGETVPMRSYLVGLDEFIYYHTLCMRAAKALARLCKYTGSSEPSLFDNAICTCTKIPCVVPYLFDILMVQ